MILPYLVQNYLAKSASAKYEFTDADLTTGTISEYDEAELAAMPLALSSNIDIDPEIGRYIGEKSAYIQYTRERENLGITNYSCTYSGAEVVLDGDCATVTVNETVGMRYDGLDEDSSISTTYDVDLINTPDGWKISNIESNDWFDEMRREGFDYEEWEEQLNTNTISVNKTLSEKGLYKITFYARQTSSSSSNVESTMAVRTY